MSRNVIDSVFFFQAGSTELQGRRASLGAVGTSRWEASRWRPRALEAQQCGPSVALGVGSRVGGVVVTRCTTLELSQRIRRMGSVLAGEPRAGAPRAGTTFRCTKRGVFSVCSRHPLHNPGAFSTEDARCSLGKPGPTECRSNTRLTSSLRVHDRCFFPMSTPTSVSEMMQ